VPAADPPDLDLSLDAPIPRRRLMDPIVERLTALIMEGKLEPGTVIRQEKIASRLGVSRTPLREALRQLEQEGLVVFLPNGAAKVARYDQTATMEMWQLREVVDGLAARVGAERGLSPAAETALAGLVDRLEQAHAAGDLLPYLELNRRFHTTLLEASDHRPLQQFASLVRITSRAIYTRQRDIRSGSAGEHRRILDAVRERRPEDAEAAARAHIRNAADFWLRSAGVHPVEG
jgi:GntR family transcriptional regulator of vanillate catabolism